jgi:hypothetical protein
MAVDMLARIEHTHIPENRVRSRDLISQKCYLGNKKAPAGTTNTEAKI